MMPSSRLVVALQQKLRDTGYDFHAEKPEDMALPVFWWSFEDYHSTEMCPAFLSYEACLDHAMEDFFNRTAELVAASQGVIDAYVNGLPQTAVSKLNDVLMAITVTGHHSGEVQPA